VLQAADGARGVIFKEISEGHYCGAEDTAHGGIEFHASRLRYDRHELHGELSVAGEIPGVRIVGDRCFSIASMNFSSSPARKSKAGALAAMSPAMKNLPLVAMLEEFCQLVLLDERAGQPSLLLRAQDPPPLDRIIVCDGLPILRNHQTIIFGDGGTAKSLLALRISGYLQGAGQRVLYCDWELDQHEHRARLGQLYGLDRMPDVRYVRCERPLVHEVDRLKRIIAEDHITFGVFDSCGYALASGGPESSEESLGYFRAARQLRIGGLHLAHVSKAENGDQKPFGSAFWHNSARATWFVKALDVDTADQLTIGLFNRKSNLSQKMAPLAYRFAFSATAIDVEQVQVAGLEGAQKELPLWRRIESVLESPMTITALADELGAKKDSVEKSLKMRGDKFEKAAQADDRVTRWQRVSARSNRFVA
jgi:hypothetical protein